MGFNYTKNLAQSSLAAGYTAGNTTLTVQTGDGSKFDTAPFVVAIDNPPQFFLQVTNVSGDTLTVDTSGFDGSTAVSVSAATPVTEVISAGVLQSLLLGAGGTVLLAEHTASNSATLDFTSRNAPGRSGALFQSDFDEYEVHLIQVSPVASNPTLEILFSTDGGSTYDTGAHYENNAILWLVSVAAATSASGAAASVLQTNVSNTSGFGMSMKLTIANPLGANYVAMHGTGTSVDGGSGDRFIGWSLANFWSVGGANAFRMLMSSGNISSGTVRVYGIRK